MAKYEKKNDEYWNKNIKVNDNGITEKLCSNCGIWKEENYENFYYKNKKYPEKGFTAECKTCTKNRTKKWIEDNQEHYYEYIEYRGKNPSEQRKKTLSERSLKQRLHGYFKEWGRNNPDKLKEYRLKREMHKKHDITNEELQTLYRYANHSCMYCGMIEEFHKYLYNEVLHKDHAYNDGSNGIDNCILACKSCNSSKRKKDWNKWFNPKNPIYDINTYNKIEEWLLNHEKHLNNLT